MRSGQGKLQRSMTEIRRSRNGRPARSFTLACACQCATEWVIEGRYITSCESARLGSGRLAGLARTRGPRGFWKMRAGGVPTASHELAQYAAHGTSLSENYKCGQNAYRTPRRP